MVLQQQLTDERNARFLKLFQPVKADCERWVMHLAQDATVAEDVLQQAILMGLQSIHQLKNDIVFKAWMFRIIRNAFLQSLRTGKREPESADPETMAMHSPRDDDWTGRDERSKTVRQLLSKLPPEQRQALWLFEVEGLSIRETSAVMGKSEGAVRVILHRARQRFAESLAEANIFPGEGT